MDGASLGGGASLAMAGWYALPLFLTSVCLQLHDVSMVHDMDIDRRNLIVYDMVTGTKFLLRAAKTSLRDSWLNHSSGLIQKAKKDLAARKASRSRCASEPVEFSRTNSFSRGKAAIKREREGSSRRRLKRPSSSSGVRMVSPGSEEMVRGVSP